LRPAAVFHRFGNITVLMKMYGKRPYEWGSDPDRQKANTKEEEKDLGLLNEGMRYRDLETGTFLTGDPIGYKDGPNRYCYVHCNPITKFDPLGLKVEYETAVAERVVAHILEHGSPRNQAELQRLIEDKEHVYKITSRHDTLGRDFKQSNFNPGSKKNSQTRGVGSGGTITLQENRNGLHSLESSAAHEIRHAYESSYGALQTEAVDDNQNGISDNEDRAVDSQRSYQLENGEEPRKDYNQKGPTPPKPEPRPYDPATATLDEFMRHQESIRNPKPEVVEPDVVEPEVLVPEYDY